MNTWSTAFFPKKKTEHSWRKYSKGSRSKNDSDHLERRKLAHDIEGVVARASDCKVRDRSFPNDLPHVVTVFAVRLYNNISGENGIEWI